MGYRGVAVEVPSAWGVNETRCGTPMNDTVDFRPHRGGDQRCLVPQHASSLTWAPLGYPRAAGDIGAAKPVRDVAGLDVRRTPTTWNRCSPSSLPTLPCLSTTLWHGAVVVPSLDVVIWVDSRDKAIVREILDSVRPIPEGYTAVPDFTGLFDDKATPLAEQAGLVWKSACPTGAVCDMSSIEATVPAAGTVVPLGTIVTQASAGSDEAGKAPRLNGRAPMESDLVGSWRVVALLGQPAPVEISATSRGILTFSLDGGLRWGVHDGCNSWGGKMRLGVDGTVATFGIDVQGCGPSQARDLRSFPELVDGAAEVRLDESTLALFDDAGSPLAAFERVGKPVSQPQLTSEERRVAESFIRFAQDPRRGGPLDTVIALGLGGELVTTISTEQSSDLQSWVVRIPATGYGERSPGQRVSALELISYAGGLDITSDLGTCAGPAVVPASLGGAGRLVSIRPSRRTSCVDQWSVVISINDVGQVAAVTVYLGAP